jgi:hypothetical protein
VCSGRHCWSLCFHSLTSAWDMAKAFVHGSSCCSLPVESESLPWFVAKPPATMRPFLVICYNPRRKGNMRFVADPFLSSITLPFQSDSGRGAIGCSFGRSGKSGGHGRSSPRKHCHCSAATHARMTVSQRARWERLGSFGGVIGQSGNSPERCLHNISYFLFRMLQEIKAVNGFF